MQQSDNWTSDPAACETQLLQVSHCRPGDESPRRFQFRSVVLALFIACCGLLASAAWAQDMATGSLNLTVQDASGAAINGAQLELRNLGTNDIHTSATKGSGGAVIPYLAPARYALTVSKEGFSAASYPLVVIQTSQVTSLKVTLAVGSSTQTVSVSGDASPLLDTSSNTIATTVDLKLVEDLPLEGRDVSSFAFLVPGAVDGLTFNNLPGGAVNIGANGFSTMTNRNKSGGFSDDGSSTVNRIEDVQEMTVQTSELDASQGGTGAMNIGFTTRSGTNQFHGRLFEDYRNDALNANSWYNNYTHQNRSKEIINDFGASIGGPLIKDKLFFFVSLANLREPKKFTVSTSVPTDAAAAGIYSYIPSKSTTAKSVNVLQVGASAGCANCPGTINTLIAGDLANIKASQTATGATMTNNIDLNHNQVNFQNKENIVQKFPTLRLDYNLTQNFRLTASVNESNSYYTDAGAPPYPGAYYANQAYSSLHRNYQIVTGFDWTLKPNLVNSFRVGYLYSGFIYNSQGMNTPTANMMEQGDLAFGFGLTSGVNGFNQLKGGSLYPVLSVKDDMTWVHGNHTVSYGVESATEIDHYYNNQFVPYIGVDGIATGDPVASSLDASVADGPTGATTDVEGLYATLTGRMTYYSLGEFVNAQTKQFQPGVSFNLHERLNQTALFIEDSWRVTPTLTINAGLRWDLTGASTDETGFYTHPDVANLWGPSGVGNIFKPGTLTGVQDPVEGPHAQSYAPTYVHPEPNFGFAWNPHGDDSSFLGKLLGDGKTVVRGSFTFKNYTEGAQNFWNFGSNNGANFNTYYYADPVAPSSGVTPGAGFYNAGSVNLGGALPSLASTSPSPYQSVIPMSYQAFSETSYLAFDPHIQQPYVESWTLGVQRQLNHNNVLEVRYLGNVAKRQWMPSNYNETNIFENGFLSEFKLAQQNLAASGGTTFAGSNALPILTQAFANAGGSSNFTDSQFITYLQQGQAGAFAGALASNSTYLCSLVGATWSPCGNSGGSYPINFFQENPFAAGAAIMEMKAQGFSNYNSLQVDFRQNAWHGMQFDANYTLSKSLGTSAQGSTAPGYYSGRGNSAPGYYTERNHKLNYFPSAFDVRNVLHLSGTYDLPFGRGRQFFNNSRVANSIIGGWTVGTILTYSGGDPYLFTGDTYTFNATSDSGIDLKNVTAKQLQHQIHPRYNTGHPWVSMFDKKYIGASGISNTDYIAPHDTAGTLGQLLWLHAPKWINTDMSVNKTIPLAKGVIFKLQGEFLNAFNHTAWSGMTTDVQSTSFGSTTATMNNPRNIEIRANFQF